MAQRRKYLFIVALVAAIAAVLASCGGSEAEVLPRQDLFSLPVGKAEDAIDLFRPDGVKSPRKNRIAMRNGIFAVANGSANKVMEFSSYGDLLGLLYNPQDNPRPVAAGSDGGRERLSNRVVVPYTFLEVGEIALTPAGSLLVEDRVPESRSVRDATLGVRLERVILRFDRQRRYVDYLGQEGVGGSPLPFIHGLHVTAGGDIVAVTRTPDRWLVFWYSESGARKQAVAIGPESLPVLAPGSDAEPSLAEVLPDPELPLLYLSVDYYRLGGTMASGGEAPLVESRVYTLNAATGAFESWFALPRETQALPGVGGFEAAQAQSLQRFVGVAAGGRFLFVNHVGDDRYQLAVIDRNGRVRHKRLLLIEDSRLIDEDFHVTPEGVLSALLGFDDGARGAWWRVDRLENAGAAWR